MTLHTRSCDGPTYLPSPPAGVWHLGPLPIHAYALCILIGIVLAVWLTDRRWRALGGEPQAVERIADWASPFGIVGGRIYHVITDPSFTSSRDETRGMPSESGRAAWAFGGRSLWVPWVRGSVPERPASR